MLSYAAVTVPSQIFNLGSNTQGVWDRDSQTLTIESSVVGTGKIERSNWFSMVNSLQLTTQEISKIEFKTGVLFPNDASKLFYKFNTEIILPDNQDTSNVISMKDMFRDARIFTSDLSRWNVSQVRNMSNMFAGAAKFTSDLSGWNTSNVTSMDGMFADARIFTSDLSRWNVSQVRNMNIMFAGATKFTSDLSGWNTSNVTDMGGMFRDVGGFNSDLSDWNTSQVKNMASMFNGASSFNSDLSRWNVSQVEYMQNMFKGATSFNSDLSDWNTSQVKNMASMFNGASSFNSDLSRWNVSQVEYMQNMFKGATSFNSDLSDWNTSKVANMENMFNGANSFDQDISNRDFSSIRGKMGNFIVSSNYTYSTENYKKLLNKWKIDRSAGKLNASSWTSVAVSANYCTFRELRDEVVSLGIHVSSDRFWCNESIIITAPTTQNNSEISDTTISFLSDLPLTQADVDNGVLTIDTAATTVEYSNFDCSLDADPKKINCTIEITSTHQKSDQKLTVKFHKDFGNNRKIQTSVTGKYLIDTQPPYSAQVKIDTTSGIHTPSITLSALPDDQGAAGIEKCELSYTDENGTEQIISPLAVGVQSLSFNPGEAVHTVKVKCYDKVGNSSENVVKFPPIIEFADSNITLSKEDMNGSFSVYSPSAYPITKIEIEDTDGTLVQRGICRSQIDGSTTFPWKNTKDQPVLCEFSNITKSGTIVIKATDENGAEGQNSQSFVKDTQAPSIDIDPEPLLTGGTINFTITITDDNALDANQIAVDSSTTIDHDDYKDWNCTQENATKVSCTFTAQTPVTNGKLKIQATDKAGNASSAEKGDYIIDQTKPTIKDIEKAGSDQGQKRTIAFKVGDEGGAGLWKGAESSDPNYDTLGISWGIGDDENCSNYQMIAALDPKSVEPFELSFDFTDATQNGKYLCIVVKDKVGNTQTGHFATPININVAPTLGDASTTLDENLPVGTEIFTLSGSDINVGHSLTYKIISGNAGNVFRIDTNKLKVNSELDYETLSGYTLVIQVRDSFGLFATGMYTIKLNDIDEIKPELGAFADVTYETNAKIVPIILTGTDNIGITSWEVIGLPGGLSFDGASLTISGTLDAPAGKYSITVKAKDAAANETTKTFILTVTQPSSGGYSGGGGGSHTTTSSCSNDSCENSDTSAPIKTEEVSDDLFNPTIKTSCFNPLDKKTINQGNKMSELLRIAHQMLYSYELTRWQGTKDFAPERSLTREEAARFMTEFATNVLCRKQSRTYNNHFIDLGNADPTLLPYIKKSYEYLIFNGDHNADGKKEKTTFRPKELITVGELAAIMTRLVRNELMEEVKGDWSRNYKMYISSITPKSHLVDEMRGTVAEVIYDLYRNNDYELREIGYVIKR